MVLLKPSVFVQLVRKFEPRVKCEVIFRQCSVFPVKKQIDQQFESSNALIKNEEKPLVKLISEANVISQVPLNSKIENSVDETSSWFDIHRENFYEDDYLHGFTPKVPKALDPSTEDLSDLSTVRGVSFNIASFVEKSNTLQQLVKLGVQLWEFDKHLGKVKMLINLDFEKDVKPYIQFLHDSGVPANQLGNFITKFPRIFQTDLDDLHTRIRYMMAHEFTPEMIATIITKHPPWLSVSTQEIDTRLGYFQHEFKLPAREVKLIALKMPKLITYSMMSLEKKTFAFKKEMGFEDKQIRSLLIKSPRLWTKSRRNLVESFDFSHSTMNLDHDFISKQPFLLLCRKSRLECRHKFLVKLKRAQYDPSKPLYVSPEALVTGRDADFCANVANTTIITYNMFLKSL